MRILILGGSKFLGRYLVSAALLRDHQVTIFNRGQTNPALFPNVEKLRGDRDGSLDALKGRVWDAVIDTCGYIPRIVNISANLLAGTVGRYTFISTISVYNETDRVGIDERSSVGKLVDENLEEINGDTYGPLKAACENRVMENFPTTSLIIRPGLIVGPYDPTDRFTYWPARIGRGGEVLVPEGPDFPVQLIDVRDLADWTIRMTEAGNCGVYNATGPAFDLSFGELIDCCRVTLNSDAIFTWVDTETLIANNVSPWTGLPLWLPGEEYVGIQRVRIDRAINSGLTFRPLANTVFDTHAWFEENLSFDELRAGLAVSKEKELLLLWHSAKK